MPKDSTSAERQRRYIARLKAAAKAAKSGVTNADEVAALRKQLAAAQVANAKLQGIADARPVPDWMNSLAWGLAAQLMPIPENLLAAVLDIDPQDWPGEQSKATNERANELLDMIYGDLRDLTAIYKRQTRKANKRRD